MLAIHANDASVRAHGGRVVEVATGLREPDDGRGSTGTRRDLLERLLRLRHERRAQQKVLRRVTGDRQLRKGHEIAGRSLGALVDLDDPRRVPLQVTHDEIELRGRDAQVRHANSLEAASDRRAGAYVFAGKPDSDS